MAKVLVFNTREHDIVLSATTKSAGIASVTVPCATQQEGDKSKLDHGKAVVDSEFLAAAQKNPVVQHYFEEGWLRGKAEQKEKEEPKS